jgi:hypothetical protein
MLADSDRSLRVPVFGSRAAKPSALDDPAGEQ